MVFPRTAEVDDTSDSGEGAAMFRIQCAPSQKENDKCSVKQATGQCLGMETLTEGLCGPSRSRACS